jgi:hypothetical protein
LVFPSLFREKYLTVLLPCDACCVAAFVGMVGGYCDLDQSLSFFRIVLRTKFTILIELPRQQKQQN